MRSNLCSLFMLFSGIEVTAGFSIFSQNILAEAAVLNQVTWLWGLTWFSTCTLIRLWAPMIITLLCATPTNGSYCLYSAINWRWSSLGSCKQDILKHTLYVRCAPSGEMTCRAGNSNHWSGRMHLLEELLREGRRLHAELFLQCELLPLRA